MPIPITKGYERDSVDNRTLLVQHTLVKKFTKSRSNRHRSMLSAHGSVFPCPCMRKNKCVQLEYVGIPSVEIMGLTAALELIHPNLNFTPFECVYIPDIVDPFEDGANAVLQRKRFPYYNRNNYW
jgi:hypothetical protein